MYPSPDSSELLPDDHQTGWPLLQSSLAKLGRISSPKIGRWMKGAVVRLALLWLSISIGFVMLQMARDAMVKSLRRDPDPVSVVHGEDV